MSKAKIARYRISLRNAAKFAPCNRASRIPLSECVTGISSATKRKGFGNVAIEKRVDPHHQKCVETGTDEQKRKILDSFRSESWPDGSRQKVERCQFSRRREGGQEKTVLVTKRAQKIAPQDGCHFVEQAFHIIGSSSPRTRRCDLVRRSSGNRKSAIPRLLYFEFFGKPLTSRSATLQQNLRLRLLLESCAW